MRMNFSAYLGCILECAETKQATQSARYILRARKIQSKRSGEIHSTAIAFDLYRSMYSQKVVEPNISVFVYSFNCGLNINCTTKSSLLLELEKEEGETSRSQLPFFVPLLGSLRLPLCPWEIQNFVMTQQRQLRSVQNFRWLRVDGIKR